MLRADILPLNNSLDLTNLANLSKAPIIISDEESSPSYPINYTSSQIPDTSSCGLYVMTNFVMSIATDHGMQPAIHSISVTLLDGNKIISSHTDDLNIPGLPSAYIQCHIFS